MVMFAYGVAYTGQFPRQTEHHLLFDTGHFINRLAAPFP